MQQLDKRFLREKQKLDHLGKDCCVIPTLCELFPKLNKRAIEERCGMIDKYWAYEREMQVIFACTQSGKLVHYSLALSILHKASCPYIVEAIMHYLLFSFVRLCAVTGTAEGILCLPCMGNLHAATCVMASN